jgi:ATP-dependent Lhr-like helicase
VVSGPQLCLADHADEIALHHGSIDVKDRQAIEAGVKTGDIKWVVCTSSLDLGVDFQPVERVVQIGSAKNLARLLQRAGRSAHVPKGTSEVFFLPTNALELLEISAFRRGLAAGAMETRHPQHKPYDVLVQHLVTLACGDGFEPRRLSWRQCGRPSPTGTSPTKNFSGFWTLSKRAAMPGGLSPLSKGGGRRRALQGQRYSKSPVCTAWASAPLPPITPVRIVYTNRKEIGTVEENFVSRLKKGMFSSLPDASWNISR